MATGTATGCAVAGAGVVSTAVDCVTVGAGDAVPGVMVVDAGLGATACMETGFWATGAGSTLGMSLATLGIGVASATNGA